MFHKLSAEVLPKLIPKGSKILVAVSGGPDSISLGHILWRYSLEESHNLTLVLTHVNHGVRPESEAEAGMVSDLALKWGVKCLVHKFDAKAYSKECGESFQAAAREWRYTTWKEDMEREGCHLLATAHHLGDQAETVLYRLIRGTGASGLAGIYPKKAKVIRPLLSVSKSEILMYCQENDLPYAIDRSNLESVYVRNKIRNELIPELEKSYNPQIVVNLGRLAEVLQRDEDYLNLITDQAWQRSIKSASEGSISLTSAIFDEHPAILSRLIRRAASAAANEPRGLGYVYVQKILESKGTPGWSQDLPGMRVLITEDEVCFSINSGEEKQKNVIKPYEEELYYGKWTYIINRRLEIGILTEDEFKALLKKDSHAASNPPGLQLIELDEKSLSEAPNPLVVRNRREGDRMWFKGVGHKAIKKVFQEAGISADRRELIPLLACGNEVLWIIGVKRSDRYMPGGQQKIYCVARNLA